MGLQDVLSVAAAVLVSLGGAGVIVVGLSSWLGQVWADRLMQRESAQHAQNLERLSSELRQKTEAELENVRSHLERETDAVLRRRAVYERIAVSMRIFLSGHVPATQEQKSEFLAAYDTAMLWAPDPVVDAIGRFLDANAAAAKAPGPGSQEVMKMAYAACLLEMRRDVGFADTKSSSYRVVSF